jgi:putative endopeptidase
VKRHIFSIFAVCLLASSQLLSSPSSIGDRKNNNSGIMLENFDQSVRPQDDFYNYVNGTWLKKEEIPNDKTTIGTFYELDDQARDNVKVIIEKLAKKEGFKPGSAEQKVSDLYQSFMDIKTIENLGSVPIQVELTNIDKLRNKDQLATYFATSDTIGSASPFNFHVDIDGKDATRYAAEIWQGSLGLPDRDYYLEQGERELQHREAYIQHIIKMFQLVGIQDEQQAAESIMALETKLATVQWTKVENRDNEKRYNKVNIKDLSELAPDFNWSAYIKEIGADNEETMIINQPSYIKGFNAVFKESNLEQWKLFLKWGMIRKYSKFMNASLDAEHFDFYLKTLHGQKEQQERWKRGVDLVNDTLGEVVGKIYVEKHFKPEAKGRMLELVENLRTAFDLSFKKLDWMSEPTKKAAEKKLEQFTAKIGYPDQWKDYSLLVIDEKDLIGNIVRISLDEHHKGLQKLGGPILKWEWMMSPQTVNAYYNPSMNEIVFPAAILQPPFFNIEADDAVNYGAIGAVIGHEMGHGFDDQGSKYDGLGNMNNWWQESDLFEFKERTKKLVGQYEKFKIFDDLNVNGELTIGENIGDLSGLTIAYKAYQITLNGKQAPIIDGLTGTQRFLIGYAQVWRVKVKEERQRILTKVDPHSPPQFRVLGPIANMDEYYIAFDVKEGDKMYLPPEKRVKMWQPQDPGSIS